jgi:hypothetical protein
VGGWVGAPALIHIVYKSVCVGGGWLGGCVGRGGGGLGWKGDLQCALSDESSHVPLVSEPQGVKVL